jgi:hypothetical protein
VTLGPFDIPSERVQALGASFTPFVNKLLDVEARRHGLQGYRVSVNANETTPDGGVDASLRDAPLTDYLPAGDSAWQFKRTGLGRQACADEFAHASWAHEFLRSGGSYILVLGAALPDNRIEERRKKVAEKAIELGLLTVDDNRRIRVYDANRLARWASQFPSLAVSRLAGGPGSVAVDYETWSSGRTHDKQWVADAYRDAAIRTIRSQVSSPGIVEVRVQGESGIGKTRLVLEALNDDGLRPLVAYVSDERSVGGELLAHLIEDGRVAILVVDECPAERHVKLVERLPADPAIRLVTIGDAGAAASRSPVIVVGAMPESEREEFLRMNYPQLGPEARRFISDHSQGNMRWTIVLADRVVGLTDAQAADLITRNDIQTFVTTILPEGRDFLSAAVLALLERVGWERELRFQLEVLARFAGVSVEQLESVGAELQQRGLLARQGRYRTVEPHPLAVLLAAEAWREHRDRILSELLPELDAEMALSLFRRVADLGRFEPARSVLPQLLSENGPFASLQQIESSGLGTMLTQLAIVLPDEVALHLSELIEGASLDELRAQTRSRRDLVWTLEKLAWHRRTFKHAANSLLRLALAENETYANNATGTWVDLFGTMLPGTAATPNQRVDYLRQVTRDGRAEVRLLAIRGAAQALVPQESISVSGELQGGVLVEPRGMPATYGEAGEYRRSMISLLASLLDDEVPEVALSAEEKLIGALHPLIADQFAGNFLADVLSRLRGRALQRLRTEAEHILSLYQRHRRDERRIVERLEALLARLPDPTRVEELQVLVHLRRWDLEDGVLQSRVERAVATLASDTERESTLALLSESNLPAAWELGRAFARTVGQSEATLDAMLRAFGSSPSGLIGYLHGLTESGHEAAFDEFLASNRAQQLDLKARLTIAVRGPVTEQSRAMVFAGLRELPVADGTYVLFGWQRNISDDDVDELINDWLPRVSSQEDYSALIDWFNLWLHGEAAVVPDRLRARALRLLMLRKDYPDVSREAWDWCRIAEGLIDEHGVEIAQLVLDLVDSGSLMILESSEESELLTRCVRLYPEVLWGDIADRLAGGSWRVQMQTQGWLLGAVPLEIIEEWVGEDIGRARLIAPIAPVGGEEPTPIARFLLGKFGEDREVASGLWAQFISGFWSGPMSEHIAQQIEQLTRWRQRSNEPLGLRTWARNMIQALEAQRRIELEREAEGGF